MNLRGPTDDIHGSRRNFECAKKVIVERFSKENAKIVLDFLETCKVLGKSYPRLGSYGFTAVSIAKLFDGSKFLSEFTKSDVEQIVSKIRDSSYSGSTKVLMALTLKRLVHFALHREVIDKNVDASKDYDDMVDWVTPTRFKDKWEKIQAKDLLTDDEILKLIQAVKKIRGANVKRDTAALFCLFEGAYRPAELLQIKIGGVEFFDDHLKIYTHGKTGPKTLTLVSGFTPVKEWISEHPDSENPEAWLFCSNNKNERMSYHRFRLLIKNITKKSGLKKKVWPYLFRHTSLTQYSLKLGNVTKVYGNWSKNSNMLAKYEHLADSDQQDAILKFHGLKKIDNSESVLFSKICEKCKERNSADKSHCSKCGNILSKKLIQAREARRMSQSKKKYSMEVKDLRRDFDELKSLVLSLKNDLKK